MEVKNSCYFYQLAKMLIISPEFKCSNEILTITAMMSGLLIKISVVAAVLIFNSFLSSA
jgi:hypothetical protein